MGFNVGITPDGERNLATMKSCVNDFVACTAALNSAADECEKATGASSYAVSCATVCRKLAGVLAQIQPIYDEVDRRANQYRGIGSDVEANGNNVADEVLGGM